VKISFPCPACAAALHVDATLAGRKGKCPTCGQRIVVPAASQPRRSGERQASGDWRTAVAEQLGPRAAASGRGPVATPAADADEYSLRPVTPVRLRHVEPAPEPPAKPEPARPPRATAPAAPRPAAPPPSSDTLGWYEDGSDGEFVPSLASPEPAAPSGPTGPSEVMRTYRIVFSLLVRASTWVSQASYTVSFFLLIIAIAAGMIGQHSITSVCLVAIVAFNLVGIVSDLASLVTLSFRKDPVQGALFLIPPCTAYYLWSDWLRYRETVGRMRIPVVMLAIVGTAYVFIPWLSGGKADESTVARVDRMIEEIEGVDPNDVGHAPGILERTLHGLVPGLHAEPAAAPPGDGVPAPSGPDPSPPQP